MVLSQAARRYACLVIWSSICNVYVKYINFGRRKRGTYDWNGVGEVRASAQVLAGRKVENHGLRSVFMPCIECKN